MAQETMIQLPDPDLVRYLAIMRRFLLATQEYSASGNRDGMLLCGSIANALHNGPWSGDNYDPNAPFGPRWSYGKVHTLITHMNSRSVSDPLRSDCLRILSTEGAPEELGFADDPAGITIAPEAKLREYLDMLKHACAAMRTITNYGSVLPRNENDRVLQWTDAADEHSDFSAVLAKHIISVPMGLVRWQQFDEAVFLRHASYALREVPFRYLSTWLYVFFPESRRIRENEPRWKEKRQYLGYRLGRNPITKRLAFKLILACFDLPR